MRFSTRVGTGLTAAAMAVGLLSAAGGVASADKEKPPHPNARLIQMPAKAFPHIYQDVSPEKDDAPTYSGVILTPAQTRDLYGSGVLPMIEQAAPYNYNLAARLLRDESKKALAQNPDGCVRFYWKPQGKDPRFPAFYVAAIATKYCYPPYLIP